MSTLGKGYQENRLSPTPSANVGKKYFTNAFIQMTWADLLRLVELVKTYWDLL